MWNDNEDTEYYNEGESVSAISQDCRLNLDQAPNQRHWHYPANFEGAATGTGTKKFGAKNKGDRWERTVSLLKLIQGMAS